jgi:hypothetical protein
MTAETGMTGMRGTTGATRIAVGMAGLLAVLLGAVPVSAQEQGDPTLTEVWEPIPPKVGPGDMAQPPSDATVLFDGRSLSAWSGRDGDAQWTVADGAMTVAPGTGDIRTKQEFGDVQLHVEWRSPTTLTGEGQERGNSGVFLMGRYEVQVLDSYESRTYSNGQAGSIYKQHIPLVNATRAPGEWQAYDIIFTAPRFASNGSVDRPATVTVLHNGVLIQNHVTLKGSSVFIGEPEYETHPPKQPLVLQDHTNLVSYRNIWVRELPSPSQ